MIPLTEKFREIREQLRGFRIRRSILFPVVLLLLFIGAGLLLAGYEINKSVFHTVFEEREHNKARNAHRVIESIVSQEVSRIAELAKILKSDTDIVYGIFHYKGTQGDTKPLKLAMNQLFPKMNVGFFLMTDPAGKILYNAGGGKSPELKELAEMPAFRRALKGESVVTTLTGPEGTGIVAIAPVYVFGKDRPGGMLILGSRIDDAFAAKIARETGNQVFIATSKKVIAGSYDPSLTDAFDPALAQASLGQRKSIFHMDRKAYRSYTYVPLSVVNEQFCLLIESDISVIRELLAKNRARMTQWGLILLTGLAVIGIGVTLLLIWPLNRLYVKALDTIREYSGSDLEALPRENEISTLVRANDVMLETIKNHLAERTRAEDAFRETSARLKALIEASPLAVVVSDTGGTVHVWNPAAVRMFGWTESETIGRPNPLLSLEGAQELRETSDRVLRGQRFSNTEICCRTREGSEIVLAFSGAPLLDAQGNITSMMAIMADITDSRKAEEALRRSEEQLRQSLKMEAVGKLAGGVAHDFNNLLSVITGYSELLLLRTDERDPVRREVEEIHKAGERAASLTHQLLAFSRRQVLKPKLLRMDEVVENIGKMLRRLIGEDVEFSTSAEEGLWTVQADPSQIEQILMNLCVNARDAMPGGGKLTVTLGNTVLDSPFIERELAIPPGRYVTLRVTDTGSGMDEEVLSRIFEPFFTTKEHGKGTGLGLATVYGIVKQSDGYIRVESALGKGTMFTVYLPAVEGTDPEAAEERPQEAPEETGGKEIVLLVEDEEMVRDLASEILRGGGYTVLDAPDGASALRICGRHPDAIDLLVTDLVMPGMNGIELAEKVTAARPGIAVLYMSGYAEDARKQLGRMARGRAFLQKPITPTNFSRKVRELLRERKGGASAGSAGALVSSFR